MAEVKKIVHIALLFISIDLHAQDPHFTQSHSAPMLVNPAYTGVFDNAQLRFLTNYRQQWSGLGDPFVTSFAGFDAKIGDNGLVYQNPFNIGLHLISDKTFNGAVKGNVITATTSYHVSLADEGKQTLGIGLGIGYGSKRIDFSSLSAESQFTNGGFDLSLPNGEPLLNEIKPYLMISPGILYTYNNKEEGTFFDFGFAVFNSNQPLLTTLYDKNERLSRRISAQASFQRYINSSYLLNAELQYQSQANVDYLLSGVSYAKLLEEELDASMIGLGLWYRTSDAIAPYLFAEFNKIRLGFTYDIQINDMRKSAYPANSFEFSLRWRTPVKKHNQ